MMGTQRLLPGSIMRRIGDAERNAYGRPFALAGEDRRPTLTWPREIPLDGHPADVVEFVGEYADWLSTSDVPKLFVSAEPGAILTGANRDFASSWPNQTEVTVRGLHFVQEDSPDEIGRAVAEWRRRLPGLRS